MLEVLQPLKLKDMGLDRALLEEIAPPSIPWAKAEAGYEFCST
jgi:hypothetical protein